jgi:hypothetical protein
MPQVSWKTLLFNNSETTLARREVLSEIPIGTHALCGSRRPVAGRFSCAARPYLPRWSVELETNLAPAADSARYATSPNEEAHARAKRRRARWTPPGFIRVSDMVDAPLSRASLYREIACQRLPAARSRTGIFVRQEDYARWLAEAAALHTRGPGSPDATAAEVEEARDD